MELIDFVKNFASQFEETDLNVFLPETHFKNLSEWSSITALSIIAMVDEEYGIAIRGNDIHNAETIEDLFKTVQAKK